MINHLLHFKKYTIMKNIIYILVAILCAGSISAQNIKPGVRTTFHAVDADGKPINEELIEVEVTFAITDANGNKVPVYSEKFSATTTKDGYFQREIGATTGDLPTVTFGKYTDVDFTNPNLCVRVDFHRTELFNSPWVMGTFSMINPVPVAAQVLNNADGDQDPKNEIQKLSKIGKEISLSKEGGSVTLEDDDPTNELQILDFDPFTKILYLTEGNHVDLSSLSQFQSWGSQLSTDKTLNAPQFTTTDGRTDIEPGKISFRYSNGQDGIEMGVEDQFCAPFINFMDCEGNSLGSFHMGPEGFKFYPN